MDILLETPCVDTVGFRAIKISGRKLSMGQILIGYMQVLIPFIFVTSLANFCYSPYQSWASNFQVDSFIIVFHIYVQHFLLSQTLPVIHHLSVWSIKTFHAMTFGVVKSSHKMQLNVLDFIVVVCFTLNIWEHGDGQSSIIVFASSSSFDFMSSSKSLVHFLTTSLDKASGSFPGSRLSLWPANWILKTFPSQNHNLSKSLV